MSCRGVRPDGSGGEGENRRREKAQEPQFPRPLDNNPIRGARASAQHTGGMAWPLTGPRRNFYNIGRAGAGSASGRGRTVPGGVGPGHRIAPGSRPRTMGGPRSVIPPAFRRSAAGAAGRRSSRPRQCSPRRRRGAGGGATAGSQHRESLSGWGWVAAPGLDIPTFIFRRSSTEPGVSGGVGVGRWLDAENGMNGFGSQPGGALPGTGGVPGPRVPAPDEPFPVDRGTRNQSPRPRLRRATWGVATRGGAPGRRANTSRGHRAFRSRPPGCPGGNRSRTPANRGVSGPGRRWIDERSPDGAWVAAGGHPPGSRPATSGMIEPGLWTSISPILPEGGRNDGSGSSTDGQDSVGRSTTRDPAR